jgi:radical SAM protein
VTAYVFDRAPVRVYWELTRACALACRHCRAEAMRARGPDELTTDECRRVLDDLAAADPPPHVIFTGGDPLERPDLFELIRHAVRRGLGVAVAPSATPALTRSVIHDLKAAGVEAMSLSLDGPTAATHDAIRGIAGCFESTVAAARHVVNAGIPLQVNTLVTAETEPELDDTAALVGRLRAARWSLFFLIAVGRGRVLQPLTARDCERRLAWLARRAPSWPFVASTTEAPHYRRVLIQQRHRANGDGAALHGSAAARGFGMRDGNGIMFIGADGRVTPSGFLPLSVGNVRTADPLTLYREAPLFRTLRDPDGFRGRCGVCEFRRVCGGSRARAWAATGRVTDEDPLCDWRPVGV